MDVQDTQNPQKILTNAELKAKLDEATKDLNQFDELANKVEEQQEIVAMEQQMNDINL